MAGPSLVSIPVTLDRGIRVAPLCVLQFYPRISLVWPLTPHHELTCRNKVGNRGPRANTMVRKQLFAALFVARTVGSYHVDTPPPALAAAVHDVLQFSVQHMTSLQNVLANAPSLPCSRPTLFSSVQFSQFSLVGVWLGLLWVLFYFFDHYIQSSLQYY